MCQFAKHQRTSFPQSKYQPSKPFSIIHSDLWGPSRVLTRNHKKWFVTFIDDHTRVCWVYLLKEKTEVRNVFQNFHSMIQTQFQTQIQVLRSDNGTEYFNSILGDYLRTKGIIHQSSCPNTPQQNGIAERKNRHLLEVARALMFTTNMPKLFWGDAILTSTYLINRMPSRILSYKTPLQTLQNWFPTSRIHSSLQPKVFGCTTFVHNHSQNLSKLDPRALKCIFIGYSPTQKGYQCYDPSTKKVYSSLDVTFFENKPFYQKTALQGEILNEDRFVNLELSTPESTPSHSGGDEETQTEKEILVYSRRPKSKHKENLAPEVPRESDPMIAPT